VSWKRQGGEICMSRFGIVSGVPPQQKGVPDNTTCYHSTDGGELNRAVCVKTLRNAQSNAT